MGNTQWGLGIHMIIFISIISLSMWTVKCLGARNLTATCSNQERLALLKFKHSVKDDFGMLSSWNDSDCCKWKRVHCDSDTGSVVSLHLRAKVDELSYLGVSDELVGEGYHLFGNATTTVGEEYQLVGYKLNSCLQELRHLKYLDLSGNDFHLSHIPEFIGSFKKLTYLNLSETGCRGDIPHNFGNLSNLKVLDLSSSAYPQLMSLDMAWVSNLSSLEYLNLNEVDLSMAKNIDTLFYKIPSLLMLSLSGCRLYNTNIGRHLNSSTKLANIKHLDLSENYFDVPLRFLIQNMTSLAFLDLSGSDLSQVWNWANLLNMSPSLLELRLSSCRLQKIDLSPTRLNFRNDLTSSIPVMPNLLKLDLSNSRLRHIEHVGIWRQCHLKELIVSYNHFEEEMVGPSTNVSRCSRHALERLYINGNHLNGSISESLGRLANLRELDLSSNKFEGPIPEALGKLRSLQKLDLSFNHLIGPIPDSLGRSTTLAKLHLESNQLTGPIPQSLGNMYSLQEFSVSSNLLNGTIPVSIGQLTQLVLLDVSNNSLQGVVSDSHFVNLSSLKYLNTAYNMLTFNISQEWMPPFQLRSAQLGSCKISDEFPNWFKSQQRLDELVLSNTNISGPLPTWLQKMPVIRVLDLSHNKLVGSLTNLPLADRFKQFRHDNGGLLLVQNNRFIGSIPKSLCTRTDLKVLDLSENRLTGKIPKCLGNLVSLRMMLLSSNRLSGVVPSSLGRISVELAWLQLNDNNLSGELPQEFVNYISLDVLDLGENKISGNIPKWIGGRLTRLKVLRLHKNNFTGKIPQSLCNLPNLHILDLAHNGLTGSIPCCFGGLDGMMTKLPLIDDPDSYSEYDGKVMQVIKGVALEYSKMWVLVTNMDLSSNKLVGEIPQELTTLRVLLGLNLSHNHLTGRIPKDIGNMTSLFSLDFSANKLTGTIPPSISALNFLSLLNLSHNNLSGQIPTGNQLQTLTDPSIYAGNRDLCGATLPNKCSNHEDTTTNTSMNKYEDTDEPKKVWFYLVIVCGFATGFWGFIGVLLFKKQWRHRLFMFTEATMERIYVAVAVRVSKMKRGREAA
ncbi:leucine-rich repeat protein [Artemisia annua]|uniref:Leucine-rich repeat protein n=1 Tax=Artemisia annua TaxID=35608 RepID=A0A2U1LJ56_ARTAN|nr:leucine-rich repeat protein [Artemisia annua]